MNDHEMGGKKPGKAPPKTIEELLGVGHEAEQASGESKTTTESPASKGKAGVMAGIVNAMNNGAVQALMKTPPSQWNDQQRLLAARYTAAANGGAAGPTSAGGFDDFSMADVARVASPGAHQQTREASADSLQQGGGQLIPQSILQAVEASTGVSVSDARYRTDQSDAVTGLGAEAATVGSTIHFAEGKFDPSSSEGQRLIAEEVLHVAQGKLGQLPQTGGISSTDMTAEVEAKAASRELTRGLGMGAQEGGSSADQTQLAHVTQALTNDIASDPFGGGFDSMFDSLVGASSAETMQSMAGMDASVSPVVDQSMPQGLAPEGGVESGGESAAPVMLSEVDPLGTEDKEPDWDNIDSTQFQTIIDFAQSELAGETTMASCPGSCHTGPPAPPPPPVPEPVGLQIPEECASEESGDAQLAADCYGMGSGQGFTDEGSKWFDAGEWGKSVQGLASTASSAWNSPQVQTAVSVSTAGTMGTFDPAAAYESNQKMGQKAGAYVLENYDKPIGGEYMQDAVDRPTMSPREAFERGHAEGVRNLGRAQAAAEFVVDVGTMGAGSARHMGKAVDVAQFVERTQDVVEGATDVGRAAGRLPTTPDLPVPPASNGRRMLEAADAPSAPPVQNGRSALRESPDGAAPLTGAPVTNGRTPRPASEVPTAKKQPSVEPAVADSGAPKQAARAGRRDVPTDAAAEQIELASRNPEMSDLMSAPLDQNPHERLLAQGYKRRKNGQGGQSYFREGDMMDTHPPIQVKQLENGTYSVHRPARTQELKAPLPKGATPEMAYQHLQDSKGWTAFQEQMIDLEYERMLAAAPDGVDKALLRAQAKTEFEAGAVAKLKGNGVGEKTTSMQKLRRDLKAHYYDEMHAELMDLDPAASHQRLTRMMDGMPSADKGSIAERWYIEKVLGLDTHSRVDKVRGKMADGSKLPELPYQAHAKMTGSGNTRFADLITGSGKNQKVHEVKAGKKLTDKDLEQFEDYIAAMRKSQGGDRPRKLDYVLTNPDALKASRKKLRTMLRADPRGKFLEISYFDSHGSRQSLTLDKLTAMEKKWKSSK